MPTDATPPAPYSDGLLHARAGLARPRSPPVPLAAGVHRLAFPNNRHARLYVPRQEDDAPLPLLVLLHGAGGQHGGGDLLALAHAAQQRFLLLMPEALSTSWDFLRGGYGPDLAFIDRLLLWTMQRYDVAADAVALGGFSDGASYALSVGLMNGGLFADIFAFSPGFMSPLRRSGMPRVFIAHGKYDRVLPVERGKAIAVRLAGEGYAVQYGEFDGAHLVSPPLAHAALRQMSER